MIERDLDRYRLVEEVGRGGMAVVYRGRDRTLDREVAVKVLHAHLADLPESRARLEREAQAVAKLHHQNILEIFDYSGQGSSESFIVTEFIHGQTLKNFLVDHPLELPEVAEMIVSEVARALEHAHQAGVIHRDVKPENVMIRSDGAIKLMDFGIAQIVDKERMTVTGQLLGSPAYMAPEHVEGRAIDFRTDVFALGILTYQLATGELPFSGKNPHEVLKRIAECRYVPPERVSPFVGARLARIINKALSRDPNGRFDDAGQMRRELVDDLAQGGIDDPRAELLPFFADPCGATRALRARLVAAWKQSGIKLAHSGRKAAALDLWCRALAHAPKDPELRQLVGSIERRRRAGQSALLVVALSGTAVVGLGARHWFAGHWNRVAVSAPAAPQQKTPVVPTTTATNGSTLSSAAAGRVVAAPVRSEGGGRRARPTTISAPSFAHPERVPPPPSGPARVVELVPTPKAVQVKLDGLPLGDFGPALSHLTLAAGAHVVRFESPSCFAKDIAVAANDSPAQIVAHLRWKNASLRVNVLPAAAAADVLIDTKTAVRAGASVPVSIDEQSLDGRRIAQLKVSANGYRTATLNVTLRAGQETVEDVTLQPSDGE